MFHTDIFHRVNLPILALVISMTSCVTGKYKVSKAPPPERVTIAVKQFSTSNYAAKTPGEKGLADFEAIYLPTRLIRTLQSAGGISNAYFTMGDTPATDFVIEGAITRSDGKNFSVNLTLNRVDGARVWTKDFGYSLAANDDVSINAITSQTWAAVAGAVNKSRADTNINLEEARAFAYTENAKLVPNEKIIKAAGSAGEIERARILAALTTALLPRADLAAKYYHKWQSESVPYITQKEQAEAEKASAEFAEVLSGFAMGLSAVAGVQAAQSGNVGGYNLMQQNMTLAAMTGEQASAQASVAENKITQLEAQLANLKQDFAIGVGRQITVTIYGKVITLNGTQAEMLSQFRKVVRDKLNAESTPPETLAEAASKKGQGVGTAKKEEKRS